MSDGEKPAADLAALVKRLKGAAYGARYTDGGSSPRADLLDEAAAALIARHSVAPVQGAPPEWRQFPAPTLERVFASGWQKPSGNTVGYWWVHEDTTDERGVPMDKPSALLWQPIPERPPFKDPDAMRAALAQKGGE
ncbi:hypothetical protein M2321_003935 [Rhodoblastus acidophilus]|uniref:hypothetical protein n=1 Tax=Rhodoblastus acidophilus TaxID=1074 RepID=UPI0018B0C12B|nr:hypothetical protein [Rhodoblastus acidophilus]MCW2276330.1 hypothetical protein [Rhodoblastus acidophilus]